MDYSKRIGKIPPYLFAEIDKAISEKKSKGVDVISLGIGDPDLPTPKNIIEELYKAAKDPQNHRYPSYEGMIAFRQAAADWYRRRFNVRLDPKAEVLTLIGSKEGIGHIPLAFLNRDDVALVSDPGYPVYRIGTILADGKPVSMPLTEENDFKPELEEIDKKIAKAARLMFINYPNAPTAATAEKDFFKEVIDFARDNNIIVCHDNPYSEMTFNGYVAPSFLEVKGAKEVGIEFNSLSKTYNMTGWRIGMAVGNNEVIAGLGRVKQNIDSGAFNAVQAAGIEALNGPQDQVRKNMNIWAARRDLMVDGLNDLGWEVRKPKATFYLWFRIPNGYDSSIEFSKKVLDETGIVITPGIGFGEHGEGYARMALTQPEDRLKEVLSRLRKSFS